GYDPRDPSSLDEPVPDYSAALTGEVRGVRIGVPTNYFFEDASPEVEAAVRRAIDALAGMGAAVVEVEGPHARYAGSAGWLIALAEAASFHQKRLRGSPELFDPLVRERLEAALFYPATDYIKSLRVRTILIDEMKEVFRRCDVMVVPGGGSVAGRLASPETAGTDVKPGSTPGAYRGGT